jgi:hypothetical protein
VELQRLLGLGFVLLFAALLAGFTFVARRNRARPRVLRDIEAFRTLPTTVGQAVETGRRLHISLGTSAIGERDTATALAGLTVLDLVSAEAAMSDKPPVITTADGAAMLLAQDALHRVYERQNALRRYDPTSARVAGLSAISFGAALTAMVKDESVAGTILIGSAGAAEAVLMTEAGQRSHVATLAGADDPSTQALLFAAADQPLVGEDVYAGGAYIGRLAHHLGSLQAQDVLRIIIGLAIVAGVVFKTLVR